MAALACFLFIASLPLALSERINILPLYEKYFVSLAVGAPGRTLTLHVDFNCDRIHLYQEPDDEVGYSATRSRIDDSELFYIGERRVRLPVRYGSVGAPVPRTTVRHDGVLGIGPLSPLWMYFAKASHTPTALALGDEFYWADGKGPLSVPYPARHGEDNPCERTSMQRAVVREGDRDETTEVRVCVGPAYENTWVPAAIAKSECLHAILPAGDGLPGVDVVVARDACSVDVGSGHVMKMFGAHPYEHDVVVIGRGAFAHSVWHYDAQARTFRVQASVHGWSDSGTVDTVGAACIVTVFVWVVWILVSSSDEAAKKIDEAAKPIDETGSSDDESRLPRASLLTLVVETYAETLSIAVLVLVAWAVSGVPMLAHMVHPGSDAASTIIVATHIVLFALLVPGTIFRWREFLHGRCSSPGVLRRAGVSFLVLLSAWLCLVETHDTWIGSGTEAVFALVIVQSATAYFIVAAAKSDSHAEFVATGVLSLFVIAFAAVCVVNPNAELWWPHRPGAATITLVFVVILGVFPAAWLVLGSHTRKIHGKLQAVNRNVDEVSRRAHAEHDGKG